MNESVPFIGSSSTHKESAAPRVKDLLLVLFGILIGCIFGVFNSFNSEKTSENEVIDLDWGKQVT